MSHILLCQLFHLLCIVNVLQYHTDHHLLSQYAADDVLLYDLSIAVLTVSIGLVTILTILNILTSQIAPNYASILLIAFICQGKKTGPSFVCTVCTCT